MLRQEQARGRESAIQRSVILAPDAMDEPVSEQKTFHAR